MIERIEYQSLEEWDPSYREEVIAEASVLCDASEWWCEPVMLFDRIGKEAFLTGSSHLVGPIVMEHEYLAGVSIPVIDDILLRLHNLRGVERVLRELSRKHEFSWELIKPVGLIGERHLGFIENGAASELLDEFVKEVASIYDLDLSRLDEVQEINSMIVRYSEEQRQREEEWKKKAQPGATDNPGDAPRLREDH